ncbi:hypothetical protein HPB47_026926, partial [Ixodes persulcatus]
LPDVRRDAKRQFFEHYEIMLHSLREYLRTVCRIYAEMKAMHIRNICSRHHTSVTSPQIQRPPLSSFKNFTNCGHSQTWHPEWRLRLSETVQLERENRLLFDRLNQAEGPARRIEAQVVGISWLQQILLDQILEQSRRADSVLGALRPAVLQVAAASNEFRLGGTAKQCCLNPPCRGVELQNPGILGSIPTPAHFDLDERRTGVRSCITNARCRLKTPG